MENEKMFDLMEKFYGEFSTFRKETKEEFKELKKAVAKIEIKLEQNIEPNIEALFDGYKQNSDKLDIIEKEVSKQEEVIIRRIK